MPTALPWWILLMPFARPAMTIVFVLLAGTIQGRTTGRWPTLTEWAGAMTTVRSFVEPSSIAGRSQTAELPATEPPPMRILDPPTQIDPPPGQDDGPIAPRDSTP
jgi:hypothetical protein